MDLYEEPVLDITVYQPDGLSASSNLDVDDGGIRLPGVDFGS